MSVSHMESKPTIVERYTKSGRHLIYRLNVLQEPERARACGSGPKSTTDRRPVDPPPVVELRIFEGPSIDQAKDITFNYNANFFLFATLEHARPMAQGRVQTPAATTPPVLTGMFVSGMAYLDRPAEAGYFLFPDLSVRHEGRYKLLFNLYEETKEDKDRDAEPNADAKGNGPAPFEDSFDWRMEVQSRPFTVYSAKKFPGLTESTSLSRTISEQGCRVRIRRDVRMRRREGKSSNKDYESRGEEYARQTRTQTPEHKQDPYRARSMSNSSIDRTPYHADAQRRPSVAEYPAPPPPAYNAAPPTPGGSGGYLQFGHSQTAPYPPQHQYPPPPQQPQSSPIVPQQPYPQPQRPYAQPAPPPPATPYRASQQTSYNYSERSSSYQSEYPPPPRDHYEDSRRSSYAVPPLVASAYPEPQREQYPARVPTPSRNVNIPPLKAIAPLEPRASPVPHARLQLPPLINSISSPRDPPPSNKRPFNMAFNDSAHSQSLVNGQRQVDPHHRAARGPLSHFPIEDSINNDPDHVQYRRANGDLQTKPLPICR